MRLDVRGSEIEALKTSTSEVEALSISPVEMFPPVSPLSLERGLHIVIQDILVWMRTQPHGIDFLFAFVTDPGFDQVLAEDSTLE